MAITITWEVYTNRSSPSGDTEYYRCGSWYKNGELKGSVETPCDSEGNQAFTDEKLIEILGNQQ